MNARRLALATLMTALVVLPGIASAKKLAAVPDGVFDEWQGAKLARADATGDGPADGLDLGRLWLGDDGQALYLRLEVGRETILQNSTLGEIGNDLRLYLDLDKKGSTGLPMGSLGVDLEVRFGDRAVRLYDADGLEEVVSPGAGLVIGMPTHSSEEFEIRVELPEQFRTKEGSKRRKRIRLVIEEAVPGGDRLPNSGAIKYKLAKSRPEEPAPISLERAEGTDLRLLSINTEDTTMATRPEVYRRLLEAVRPDIIAFQELTAWTAEQTRDYVESILSPDGSVAWHAEQQFDCVTVSAFPIVARSAVDQNLVTHIDLPGPGRDLVLFNVHPPCCDNEVGRDQEFDNLSAAWRDLLAGDYAFEVAEGDAAIFAGDYNLVGYRRQIESLRDGVFISSAKGGNFSPGRAEGSLRDPPLRHTHSRSAYTWRRAESGFAPGRLDLVLFTGDALSLQKGFVLDTSTMARKARQRAGLKPRDSELASDHLALVVDFSLRD